MQLSLVAQVMPLYKFYIIWYAFKFFPVLYLILRFLLNRFIYETIIIAYFLNFFKKLYFSYADNTKITNLRHHLLYYHAS